MCQAPFQAFYRINPFKLHNNYIKQMLKCILVMVYRYTYIDTYIHIYIYIYIYEYYSAIENNKTIPFAVTWLGLKIVMLSEVHQTEKDNYHMISLMCGV